MPRHSTALTLFCTIMLALLAADGPGTARAQVLVVGTPQVHTIAAATTGVPIEHTFNVTTAGTYQVTLTDFGNSLKPPAPLASVKLAVTSGDSLIGAPLVGAGALTLSNIAAGTYQLHLVGMPGNVPGSGPIGIVVTDSSMTQIAAFQDVVALPNQQLPNGEAVLNDTFTVPATGSYTVSLNDLMLPQPLTTLTLLIVAQGSGTPTLILPSGGMYQGQATLTAGVPYAILAVGAASAASNAGLYSAVVTAGSASGTVVYGRAVAVGGTVHLGSPALGGGNYALSLTDLNFANALTQVGAVLLLNGQVVPGAQLAAAGSANFTAAAATYDAYAAGTAAATAPGTGSYALQIAPQGGGAPAFDVARGVTTSGSALSAFSFQAAITASGAQLVSLTDFQFPVALASVSLGAEQAGALLGTPLAAAGSLNISPVAGPMSLVVFAQGGGNGTGGGLFGIDIAPSAGATPVYDVTQAVGALFNVQQVTITAAGSYSVTATDLGFPAAFANFDTIVTKGTAQLGSIFGGGTFSFNATPGTYFVNFIAQPTGTDQAGTYGLTVATAPPAPVVTLSVDHPQVTSGSAVDLIWSSQNATTCTGSPASGGWGGSLGPSGTVTSAALTANTTFMLTCSGPGGSASQSVTVTVTSTSGGRGGGGALSVELLLILTAAAVVRALLADRNPGAGKSLGRQVENRYGIAQVRAGVLRDDRSR